MTSPNVVEEVVVVQEECGDEYILPEYTMSTPSTNSTHQSDEAPYPKIPARPAKRYWDQSRTALITRTTWPTTKTNQNDSPCRRQRFFERFAGNWKHHLVIKSAHVLHTHRRHNRSSFLTQVRSECEWSTDGTWYVREVFEFWRQCEPWWGMRGGVGLGVSRRWWTIVVIYYCWNLGGFDTFPYIVCWLKRR